VGKSFLARAFADRYFGNLVEINFEKTPEAEDLFADRTPERIIPRLELQVGAEIRPGKTLLFLDEIQAAPQVFACLRFFHELLPSLHVMAAGSLLEFVLEDHEFSMPVGRIEYLHLGPMTYEEYLVASGKAHLAEFLQQYPLSEDVPAPIHGQLLSLLREFLVIGGMPEAVQAFIDTRSFLECDKAKQSVLSTYVDDFSKYGRRVNARRLQRVFQRLPHVVGSKFKHSHVDREEQSRAIGKALHLLCLARVAHKVYHSSCNGVPLGAEVDEKNYKVLFLDVGLLCRACGLSLLEFESVDDVILVNSGAVCEQFVGQHLLYSRPFFEEPELYYWSREKRQSAAEVDYVQSIGAQLIPIEVKAGKSGRLKSLHLFLKEKKRTFGLRFSTDLPSLLEAQTAVPGTKPVQYRLLSLPLYMVGQARRLCQEHVAG
jgi:predicted AAA+ superfamily ATPase